MAKSYVKLYFDLQESLIPLGDAERGRLLTAILMYASSGEVPQLGGNERFVFPTVKAQIDRENRAYEKLSQTRADAGSKGGKAKASKC